MRSEAGRTVARCVSMSIQSRSEMNVDVDCVSEAAGQAGRQACRGLLDTCLRQRGACFGTGVINVEMFVRCRTRDWIVSRSK